MSSKPKKVIQFAFLTRALHADGKRESLDLIAELFEFDLQDSLAFTAEFATGHQRDRPEAEFDCQPALLKGLCRKLLRSCALFERFR